jgi:hypothetical protein
VLSLAAVAGHSWLMDVAITDDQIEVAKGLWLRARPVADRVGAEYGLYLALVQRQSQQIAEAFRAQLAQERLRRQDG